MNRFLGLGLGILFCGISAQAQTLFTYGEHPVSKDEFLSVYEKNNNGGPEKNTSVSEYLNLYAMFRMKVQSALDMKMDTTAAVVHELENYKAQLTRSELVDKEVTAKLVAEAYDRMKKDIKVAHILVAVRPNEDSSRAWHLIDSIYNVLQEGKTDFATLAKKYSDDQTTAVNGGEIGYITALQTPYSFESAAYTTPIGQYSQPFRTNYGFHILKVEDSRPDPGQVQVAQILVASPEYKGAEARNEALSKAKKIEEELKKGADFSQLVTQYSDDRYTKDNKGIMTPFGIGKMTPEFEKAAFSLQKLGDISQPIATEYGYHILKLVRKIPLQPLDSIKDELTAKVKNDAREAKAKDAYQEKVKEKYHFKDYPNNFQQLLSVTEKDTSKNLSPERYPQLKQPLFELDGKTYSQETFLAYAQKLTKGNFMGKKENILKDLYYSYQNKSIMDLQQQKLFESRPRLKDLMTEYKNGILLFDLMDKKVWNKASADSAGLHQFFEKNQAKYTWEPGFEGTVFYAGNKQALQQLKTYLEQGEDAQVALDNVNKQIEGHSGISRQTGRFPFAGFPVSGESLTSGKPSVIFENNTSAGSYGLLYINKLFPQAEQKTMEDARGYVVADYQDYLEKQWEASLKKKYPLKINEKELKKLEKKLH